jgi:N-methylhydantoinase A
VSTAFRIGVDVGGTFTDVVCVAADGTTTLAKAASTPADQSEGVVAGLGVLAERLGLALPDLLARTERIVHGTTVATNALLERRGAKVAMLTTEGHRDVIEMREGLKPDRYDLRLPAAPALVPRRLRLPVHERIRPDGRVDVPLDAASLDAAIATLKAEQVEAVAICFLHAWRTTRMNAPQPRRCAPRCLACSSPPARRCCRRSRSSNASPPPA